MNFLLQLCGSRCTSLCISLRGGGVLVGKQIKYKQLGEQKLGFFVRGETKQALMIHKQKHSRRMGFT